jgi:predicted alpha/beta hydrolase
MRRPSRTPEQVSSLTIDRALRRGESRALGVDEVRSTVLSIPAADGLPLAASFYAPAARPEGAAGTVVLASATGVKRHFYDAFARHVAERGFRVLTFDYRGIGGSRPAATGGVRQVRATMRDWGERDLEGVLAWTAERFRGDPLRLLGHSVGGQLLGLAPSADRVDRAAFVGSQSGYLGHYELPWRWAYRIVMHAAIPVAARTFGYFPASRLGLGEDLPGGVAAQWARWCRDPAYFFADGDGVPREGYERLRMPLLAVGIADDTIAPPRAVDALVRVYANAAVERVHLRPADVGLSRIGHFGFFRPPAAPAWRVASDWITRA